MEGGRFIIILTFLALAIRVCKLLQRPEKLRYFRILNFTNSYLFVKGTVQRDGSGLI
jgi:hypothetical protein